MKFNINKKELMGVHVGRAPRCVFGNFDDLESAINKFWKTLESRERNILKGRLGFKKSALMSYREISAELGISPNAVSDNYYRVLVKLKTLYYKNKKIPGLPPAGAAPKFTPGLYVVREELTLEEQVNQIWIKARSRLEPLAVRNVNISSESEKRLIIIEEKINMIYELLIQED